MPSETWCALWSWQQANGVTSRCDVSHRFQTAVGGGTPTEIVHEGGMVTLALHSREFKMRSRLLPTLNTYPECVNMTIHFKPNFGCLNNVIQNTHRFAEVVHGIRCGHIDQSPVNAKHGIGSTCGLMGTYLWVPAPFRLLILWCQWAAIWVVVIVHGVNAHRFLLIQTNHEDWWGDQLECGI